MPLSLDCAEMLAIIALFQVPSAATGLYSSISVIFLETNKENEPDSIARNQKEMN